MEKRGILWAGGMFALVAFAYAVPYLLLTEVNAWYGGFLFWTVFGLAAIAAITVMTRGWRD